MKSRRTFSSSNTTVCLSFDVILALNVPKEGIAVATVDNPTITVTTPALHYGAFDLQTRP
jgi:hypothetical protein